MSGREYKSNSKFIIFPRPRMFNDGLEEFFVVLAALKTIISAAQQQWKFKDLRDEMELPIWFEGGKQEKGAAETVMNCKMEHN